MSAVAISDIAIRFGLTFWVVKSWIEQRNIKNPEEAVVFFEENITYIKAQPFVKWVGGKRQLIEQFQKLFPTELNNYFESFFSFN